MLVGKVGRVSSLINKLRKTTLLNAQRRISKLENLISVSKKRSSRNKKQKVGRGKEKKLVVTIPIMLIEICHSKKGDQIVMAKFCHTMGGKYKEAKKRHLL